MCFIATLHYKNIQKTIQNTISAKDGLIDKYKYFPGTPTLKGYHGG